MKYFIHTVCMIFLFLQIALAENSAKLELSSEQIEYTSKQAKPASSPKDVSYPTVEFQMGLGVIGSYGLAGLMADWKFNTQNGYAISLSASVGFPPTLALGFWFPGKQWRLGLQSHFGYLPTSVFEHSDKDPIVDPNEKSEYVCDDSYIAHGGIGPVVEYDFEFLHQLKARAGIIITIITSDCSIMQIPLPLPQLGINWEF